MNSSKPNSSKPTIQPIIVESTCEKVLTGSILTKQCKMDDPFELVQVRNNLKE